MQESGRRRDDQPGGRGAPALPAMAVPWLFRRPLAPLWLRPWFDSAALRFIRTLYFPASHAWALAAESEDAADLCRRLGALTPSPALERAVAAVRRSGDRHAAAERHWRQGFFLDRGADAERRAALQAERIAGAHDFMATRRLFGRWRRSIPAAGWAVATPAEVAAAHGPRLENAGLAYPVPAIAAPQRSASVASAGGTLSWLTFPSPQLGDRVTARVLEPAAVRRGAPTLILLHGIAMEEEMWRPRYDPFEAMTAAGWRVVKPEGPWHGRRRLPGRFGGEPVLAQGLGGLLTCLQAWLAETATLVAWARAQGGPVALAGISLGALTSQLYASRATGWPAELAPDALLLIATSGSVRRAAHEGALATALGMPERMAAAGWDEAELERWLPLLDPTASAVPPGRTVMLLGTADRVTPYDSGCLLAERWQVPEENLFRRRQGHFSASLGLAADRRPLARLADLLG